MTYFHTGIRTIIGARLFHGPVRDGKGWYQPAMVVRHNFFAVLFFVQHGEFIEWNQYLVLIASLGITKTLKDFGLSKL